MMDPLEAAFLFCFVFGLALSGLSFLLGAFHMPGLGHHVGSHGMDGSHGHVGGAGDHGALAHGGAGGGHGGSAHGGEPGHPGGGHADSPSRLGHDIPSPVNVNTATAFLAFFGGVGYVLYGTLGVAAGVALVVAVLAGLAGGAVVFMFLVKVLLAGQRFLNPEDFRLEGSLAQVTRSIRADGIGEIVYSRDGTRRSEGARSATGEAIAAGTEVVVVRYERGIAYVESWASYAGDAER